MADSILTGADIKQFYPETNFYNITGDIPFKKNLFVDALLVPRWITCVLDKVKFVRKVIISDDACIMLCPGGGFIADILIYEKCIPIWEHMPLCRKIVMIDGLALKYVINPSEEICCMAIRQNKNAFKLVKNTTYNICKYAVGVDGLLLADIIDQTYDICKIAVMQNGLALQHVRAEMTDKEWFDIHKCAIFQNSMAIQFIENPCENLCEIAVDRDGLSLQYIQTQTEQICNIAVCENGLALQYVKKQTLQICRNAINQNVTSFIHADESIRKKIHRNHSEKPAYKKLKNIKGIAKKFLLFSIF